MAETDVEVVCTDIYPEGDVMLVCAPSGTLQTEIRVSSLVLGMASPVFKAMLSPKFRKGKTLTATSEVEIQLPDDNGASMTRVCAALHMRHDLLQKRCSIEDLEQFVVVCVKYSLVSAIGPSAYAWFDRTYSKAASTEDRIRLLSAAAKLRLEDIVARIGRDVIRLSTDSIQCPSGDQGTAIDSSLKQLETIRIETKGFLGTAVDSQLVSILKSVRIDFDALCAADAEVARFLAQLQRQSIWPLHAATNGISIETFVARIVSFHPEELPSQACWWNNPSMRMQAKHIAKATRTIMEHLERLAYSAEPREGGEPAGFYYTSGPKPLEGADIPA